MVTALIRWITAGERVRAIWRCDLGLASRSILL